MRSIAERLAGKAAVVQINTEENPALATRFGVRGVPVVMLLRSGRIVDQLAGARTVDDLMAWFRQHP